jgi:hypothetical protein
MRQKMRYDHKDDVLMVWFSEDKQVDHAEQVGQSILHLTAEGTPVLLEILNAGEFVVDLVRTVVATSPEATATA